jgi:hypothetical protein
LHEAPAVCSFLHCSLPPTALKETLKYFIFLLKDSKETLGINKTDGKYTLKKRNKRIKNFIQEE